MIGDVYRTPAAHYRVVAVIEIGKAVQVVQIPRNRGFFTIDLQGKERFVTAGITGGFEGTQRSVVEPAEERVTVSDLGEVPDAQVTRRGEDRRSSPYDRPECCAAAECGCNGREPAGNPSNPSQKSWTAPSCRDTSPQNLSCLVENPPEERFPRNCQAPGSLDHSPILVRTVIIAKVVNNG